MRIGATSFVYRASWLENARRLAPRVDDIEILIFEANRTSDLPDAREIAGLAALGDEHALSYTVHTPLAASLASADELRRQQGVSSVLRVVETTAMLEPHAYIVHIYYGDSEAVAGRPVVRPLSLNAWRERARRSLEEIIESGVSPQRIAVETLDYDIALLTPVLDELGVSLALDLGHAQRDGADTGAVLRQHLRRATVIQWHGVDPNDRDHRSLSHFPLSEARELLASLVANAYDGVLTLEVFREDDFEASLSILHRIQREISP